MPAVGALLWLLSGFYTVGTDQTGLVTRFGRLVDQRVDAGLHYAWPWPIERVYTPRTTDVRSIDVGFTTLGQKAPEARSSDTLTGDENILKIMLVVQYKIRDPAAFLFHVEDPHWLVERTVESALSTLVAALPVDDVLTTAKDEIQVRVIARAQEMLDAHESGLVLLGGNLQVVDPPVPVGAAFKEVASAKKDSERLLDEAREYEGRVLPEARGQAERVLSAAQGAYADRLNQAQGEAARFLSVLAEVSPGAGGDARAAVRREHGTAARADGSHCARPFRAAPGRPRSRSWSEHRQAAGPFDAYGHRKTVAASARVGRSSGY